jgi:hypothetical protein
MAPLLALANERRCHPWPGRQDEFPLQSAAFGVIHVSRGDYRKGAKHDHGY